MTQRIESMDALKYVDITGGGFLHISQGEEEAAFLCAAPPLMEIERQTHEVLDELGMGWDTFLSAALPKVFGRSDAAIVQEVFVACVFAVFEREPRLRGLYDNCIRSKNLPTLAVHLSSKGWSARLGYVFPGVLRREPQGELLAMTIWAPPKG